MPGGSKKRRSSRQNTVRNWTIAAVFVSAVVLVGALVAVAFMPRTQTTAASFTPHQGPYPWETAAETDAPWPNAAFIGDSYTARIGTDPGQNWIAKVSYSEKWIPVPLGEGGTGYVNPGQPEENESVFAGRVPDAVAAAPSVVVVQGSFNDVAEPAAIQSAAEELYRELQAQLPGVPIVVIGPVQPPNVDPAIVQNSREGVQAATTAMGLPFVDPIGLGWTFADSLFMEDGVHFTNAGQQEYANQIIRALSALDVPRGS